MTVHLSTLSSTGTEGTPTGSGARYTSMVSWEAAAQGNHGAGDQTILECYKGTTTVTNWDADGTHVASVDINTWSNLTQTDNITIRAAAGNAHGGVLGAGFKVRSSGATMFRLYVPWVTMEDIEIQNDSTFSTLQCRDATGGGYFFNRIIATSNQTNGGTIDNSAYTNYVEARNSLLIVNGEGRGIYLRGGHPSKVLNCTILGLSVPLNNFGFDSQQTNLVDTLISNCVTVGFDSGDMRDGGRWTNPSNASNATGDSTAAGSDPVTGVVLTDGVDFVAPSTEDYNAQSGGKLDGVGADLSGTFTDDITGATRTQWDIGAYGIIAAGGVTFDGPDIVDQTGTQDQPFSFDENGEGTVASRFSVS